MELSEIRPSESGDAIDMSFSGCLCVSAPFSGFICGCDDATLYLYEKTAESKEHTFTLSKTFRSVQHICLLSHQPLIFCVVFLIVFFLAFFILVSVEKDASQVRSLALSPMQGLSFVYHCSVLSLLSFPNFPCLSLPSPSSPPFLLSFRSSSSFGWCGLCSLPFRPRGRLSTPFALAVPADLILSSCYYSAVLPFPFRFCSVCSLQQPGLCVISQHSRCCRRTRRSPV